MSLTGTRSTDRHSFPRVQLVAMMAEPRKPEGAAPSNTDFSSSRDGLSYRPMKLLMHLCGRPHVAWMPSYFCMEVPSALPSGPVCGWYRVTEATPSVPDHYLAWARSSSTASAAALNSIQGKSWTSTGTITDEPYSTHGGSTSLLNQRTTHQ